MLFIQWKWTVGICCGPGVVVFLCATYAYVKSHNSSPNFPWQAWATLPVTLPIILAINFFFVLSLLSLVAIALIFIFPFSILSSYAWLVLRWLEKRIHRLGALLIWINWKFLSIFNLVSPPPPTLAWENIAP